MPPRRLPSGDTRDGFAAHLEWERALHDARWSVVSWPEAYGGRDATLWEWLIFEEEYYAAAAPQRITQNGIFLLAPTIFEFGTPAQQDHYLPRMSAAEDLWCQGWSEPNAGSDLAGITLPSRSRRRSRGLACSTARRPGRPVGRSAPTCSACSAPTPRPSATGGSPTSWCPSTPTGVTVRGFGRLDGDEGFAEVFLDDVFVPDDDGTAATMERGGILGEVGQGWGVAMSTTTSERGLTLRSPGRFRATAAAVGRAGDGAGRGRRAVRGRAPTR